MEDRMMKFYSKESNMLALHAMHGHFATSHSHISLLCGCDKYQDTCGGSKTGGTCTVFENSKDKIRGYHCVRMERKWSVPFDGGDPADGIMGTTNQYMRRCM